MNANRIDLFVKMDIEVFRLTPTHNVLTRLNCFTASYIFTINKLCIRLYYNTSNLQIYSINECDIKNKINSKVGSLMRTRTTTTNCIDINMHISVDFVRVKAFACSLEKYSAHHEHIAESRFAISLHT